MILPCLTLNHVENMIINKEKLTKKNETNATFTDDGFAIGCSYILRLLGQITEFESLQWFKNVNEEINDKMNEQKLKSGVNNDEKLAQTSTLTIKKLRSLQSEFSILEYILATSLCLFRKNE